MNLEIRSKEINDNQYHSFEFSKKVSQYMIGFSKINLKYDETSHHVNEIEINTALVNKDGNTITVQPQITMNDTSGNISSSSSFIEVVVLASIGNGCKNVHLQSAIDEKIDQNHQLKNIKFIQSAIYSTSVKYGLRDHHLAKYKSVIIVNDVSTNSFNLKPEIKFKDQSGNEGNGHITGSIIEFNGNSKNVLCGCFPNKKNIIVNKNTIKVDVGTYYRGFQGADYSFCYFISGFDLSYKEGKDHHVKEINISIQKSQQNLFAEGGRIYAELTINAILKDNKHNTADIEQNKINGFVVAFKNKIDDDDSD